VWLYFRFALSYRDVEEMMAKRGVRLTYETVREWCGNSAPSMPHSCEEASQDRFEGFCRNKAICYSLQERERVEER